ncbi:hypothetical protein WMY93_032695 [Mugilogobius chulae]|uniref:Uncharacterized protein n=1 Tax=Mugilogobius chulae TaxID=88201 RepID=A0AAW0MUW3_9GOBI
MVNSNNASTSPLHESDLQTLPCSLTFLCGDFRLSRSPAITWGLQTKQPSYEEEIVQIMLKKPSDEEEIVQIMLKKVLGLFGISYTLPPTEQEENCSGAEDSGKEPSEEAPVTVTTKP